MINERQNIRIVGHFYLQTLKCIQIIGICIQLKLLTSQELQSKHTIAASCTTTSSTMSAK